MPVPRTLAVGRRVAPFGFGRPTGSGERWLRTAPREPVPGRYPTLFGWQDPFALLEESDPTHEVGAVLAQDSVDAVYSGALLPGDGKEPIIEGVAGHGDDFMLGRGTPESLPEEVTESVAETAEKLAAKLGPVRTEWAFDGARTWVVQLQQTPPPSRLPPSSAETAMSGARSIPAQASRRCAHSSTRSRKGGTASCFKET